MENELVFSEFSEFPFLMWELDFQQDGEVIKSIPVSAYEFYEYYPDYNYLFRVDALFDGGEQELDLDFWPDESAVAVIQGNMEEEKKRREDINFEQLAKYFTMPINKAAKELQVGVTFLKRRCRELNIPRWPHIKMKSLDALIQIIKERGKEEGLVEEAQLKATVEMLEKERNLVQIKPVVELNTNTKLLRQACFKANYKRRRLLPN